MKANTYYLYENGKQLHYSYSLEKLLKYTIDTTRAEIYFNNIATFSYTSAIYPSIAFIGSGFVFIESLLTDE